MPVRMLLAAALSAVSAPLAAQAAAEAAGPALSTPADELVLPSDHIIPITIDGMPLRFLVTAEANGPARVNPGIAARLGWQADFEMQWDFGRDAPLRSVGLWRSLDFGSSQRPVPVIWSVYPSTDIADGTIGIHHLPHQRVTFPLAEPVGSQSVQRFPMKRIGSREAMTLGTELDADGKTFKAFFVLELSDNLVTAPTANFIATRFDGGFVPGSDSEVAIDFSVKRRVRLMRLARPMALGDLVLDRFWVRYDDYGTADKVGEMASDDPRFSTREIVVSQRKQRGRADYLTRIGRAQIAHCSSLTYDLALGEISLTCGASTDGSAAAD